MFGLFGSSAKTAQALEDAGQRRETAAERLRSLLSDVEDLEAQVEDAERTRDRLEERHASAIADADRLSDGIEALDHEIRQLQTTYIERVRHRDELKDNIERTETNIKDVIARYAPEFAVPAAPPARPNPPTRPAYASDDDDDDVPLSQLRNPNRKKRPHAIVATKSASVVVDGGGAKAVTPKSYAPPTLELGGDVCFSTFVGKGGQKMADVRRWVERRADGARVPMKYGRNVGVTMTHEAFHRMIDRERSARIDEALETGRSIDLSSTDGDAPSVHVSGSDSVRIQVGEWQTVTLTRDQWTALKRAAVM